jgi:hypothetical protein
MGNRLILRSAIIVFGSLLIIITVLIYTTRQQPESALLADFRPCEGKVCVLDITPGKTLVKDATAFIKSNPQFKLSRLSEDQAFKQSDPFYRIGLYKGTVTSVLVDEVKLDFRYGSYLSAGAIVARFGPPCGIHTYIPDHLVLAYPGMVVFVAANIRSGPRAFVSSLPVTEINFFDNRLMDCSQISFDKYTLQWRGFRTY